MTNQEAFDKMVTHLRTQGMRCMGLINKDPEIGYPELGETCVYRGEGDMRCAVGCLIPDDQYKDTLEGTSVEGIVDHVAALKGISVELLGDMQVTHDDHPLDDWEYRFEQAATDFELTYTPK